jgi:hypothetical protein
MNLTRSNIHGERGLRQTIKEIYLKTLRLRRVAPVGTPPARMIEMERVGLDLKERL